MDILEIKQHAKEIITKLNMQKVTKEEADIIFSELDSMVLQYYNKKYRNSKKIQEYTTDITKEFETLGCTWEEVEQIKATLKEEASKGLESYKIQKFKSLENES